MSSSLVEQLAQTPIKVALIWAQSTSGVIGAAGTIPWRLPEDLHHFKDLTWGYPVIMGRGTWESLPEKFRPLPGRDNIVVSTTSRNIPGAYLVASPAAAIAQGAQLLMPTTPNTVWIVGGGQLYRQFLAVASDLHVTYVDIDIAGDTHAPYIDDEWQAVSQSDWEKSSTGLKYRFVHYKKN